MGSNGFTWYLNNVCINCRCVISTPWYNSVKCAEADLGAGSGADGGGTVVSPIGGVNEASTSWLNAVGGMDLRARARTSAVSRRSEAKRVIAKSRCCSFSRAALR